MIAPDAPAATLSDVNSIEPTEQPIPPQTQYAAEPGVSGHPFQVPARHGEHDAIADEMGRAPVQQRRNEHALDLAAKHERTKERAEPDQSLRGDVVIVPIRRHGSLGDEHAGQDQDDGEGHPRKPVPDDRGGRSFHRWWRKARPPTERVAFGQRGAERAALFRRRHGRQGGDGGWQTSNTGYDFDDHRRSRRNLSPLAFIRRKPIQRDYT
jgi:hypothetical protein